MTNIEDYKALIESGIGDDSAQLRRRIEELEAEVERLCAALKRTHDLVKHVRMMAANAELEALKESDDG